MSGYERENSLAGIRPAEEEAKQVEPEETKQEEDAHCVFTPEEWQTRAAIAESQRLDALGEQVQLDCCDITLRAFLAIDHATFCPRTVVPCYVCGATFPRGELWTRHLSLGRCPRYVTQCSSFQCQRAENTPGHPEHARMLRWRDTRPPPAAALPAMTEPRVHVVLRRIMAECKTEEQGHGYRYQSTVAAEVAYGAIMAVSSSTPEDAIDLLNERIDGKAKLPWASAKQWNAFLERDGLAEEFNRWLAIRVRQQLQHFFSHLDPYTLASFMCLCGCDIAGGETRTGRGNEEHHQDARAKFEAERFFIDPQPEFVPRALLSTEVKRAVQESRGEEQKSDSDSTSSSSASFPPLSSATVLLSHCPTCLQRLCIQTAPASEAASSSSSTADDSSTSSSIVSLLSPAHESRYHPRKLSPECAPSRSKWPEIKLTITQEEANQHASECAARREAREAARLKQGFLSRVEPDTPSVWGLGIHSPYPKAYDSTGTGIYKYQPRAPDMVLMELEGQQRWGLKEMTNATPASAAVAAAAEPASAPVETAFSSSLPSSSTSSSASSAAPIFRYSFPEFLRQAFLLQYGSRLQRSSTNDYLSSRNEYLSPEERAARQACVSGGLHKTPEVCEALLVQGGDISDLINMYQAPSTGADASPASSSRLGETSTLRPGVKRLYDTQPSSLDTWRLLDALAPLQRPLVKPLVEEVMIKDLANIVLEYF
jgi:hypothetical protein